MRLRRCVVIGLALWLCGSHAAIAQSAAPVGEVAGLRLFSDFWLNLLSLLYASAWARRVDTPPQRRLAMPLPKDSVVLTDEERATWDAAVSVTVRSRARL